MCRKGRIWRCKMGFEASLRAAGPKALAPSFTAIAKPQVAGLSLSYGIFIRSLPSHFTGKTVEIAFPSAPETRTAHEMRWSPGRCVAEHPDGHRICRLSRVLNTTLVAITPSVTRRRNAEEPKQQLLGRIIRLRLPSEHHHQMNLFSSLLRCQIPL